MLMRTGLKPHFNQLYPVPISTLEQVLLSKNNDSSLPESFSNLPWLTP